MTSAICLLISLIAALIAIALFIVRRRVPQHQTHPCRRGCMYAHRQACLTGCMHEMRQVQKKDWQ